MVDGEWVEGHKTFTTSKLHKGNNLLLNEQQLLNGQQAHKSLNIKNGSSNTTQRSHTIFLNTRLTKNHIKYAKVMVNGGWVEGHKAITTSKILKGNNLLLNE